MPHCDTRNKDRVSADLIMCRWAAYRGNPVFLETLLTEPTHSLIAQSRASREAPQPAHGDGFGLAWYGERPEPGHYRDVLPAWSDCNLQSLARQVRSGLFLAHVRASTGSATSRQNCHPFVHARWSFMHNGHIGEFARLERRLEAHLSNMLYQRRQGATDSELLFLLALQFGLARDPYGAVSAAIALVAEEAANLGIEPVIRATLAFSEGEAIYATRFASDGAAPSLYLREGPDGISLVSEPLDAHEPGWREIAPQSFLTLDERGVSLRPFNPLRQVQALRA